MIYQLDVHLFTALTADVELVLFDELSHAINT